MTNDNPSKGSTMQSLFEELGEWEEVKAMADKKTTPITTVDILASRPSLLSRIKGYLIGKLDWFDHVILGHRWRGLCKFIDRRQFGFPV